MAREMTPQERAAAVIDQMVVNMPPRDARLYNEQVIENALRQTRQAALREAAEVAEKCKNESALGRVRDAYSYVEANLRKLAQEG